MRYMLFIYDDESVDQEILEREFPEWIEYSRRLREAGIMLEGEPLEPSQGATSVRGNGSGSFDVTDGPFVETKEALGGYYVIEAEDLKRATEIASQMPHVKRGGGVVIRPILELNG